jgi:hypothetical protein
LPTSLSDQEYSYLDKKFRVLHQKINCHLGVKEAIFKLNEKGISFKDHIRVKEFEMDDLKAEAELHLMV